eukprot:2590466-Pleurochrysis_carterae.AAC.1
MQTPVNIRACVVRNSIRAWSKTSLLVQRESHSIVLHAGRLTVCERSGLQSRASAGNCAIFQIRRNDDIP